MSVKSYGILLLAALLCTVHVDAQSSSANTNMAAETASGKVVADSIGGVEIPASIEILFSPESTYLTLCRFVQDLKSDLQDDEVAALIQFIASSPKDVGLTRDHFNSVGDKVINALQRQHSVPPVLIDSLITMFNDKSGDFTWRDYCIQHLGQVYATDAADGKRDQILQVWSDAIKPESRMAGSVVLALRNNIGQEGISKEYAVDKISVVAVADAQPDASRLTAIQIAAELGNHDMLPLARKIVPSKHSVPFRMSAMATIGILGDASDLDLLNQYTKSSDIRLRTASRAAVKKIQARSEQ